MKKFIYYPGFEVRQRDWLKFALLYLEELCPIVPLSGEPYLTDLAKKLINETDILNLHDPSYNESELATYEVVNQVEKIVQRPSRYTSVFNTPDILEEWRNPNQQQFLLFQEKYTGVWEDFCFENGFARYNSKGILISNQLGLIYMSILAHTIADTEGVSPITDYPELDRFSIFTHHVDSSQEDKFATAQSVFELKLPSNLNDISIDTIIKLRNRPQFKERLRAFHSALDDFVNSIEEGVDTEEFARSLGNIWSDFLNGEIVQLGAQLSSCSLGIWLLTLGPGIAIAPFLREALGGLAILLGSISYVKSTWSRTETRRLARRYLADVTKLTPANLT